MALHHYVAWVNFLWFGAIFVLVLRLIARYRIRNKSELREKANLLMAEAGDRPTIICSNHLTLIDSMIITWAICPPVASIVNFKRVPWHMPEFANFAKNFALKFMCYLGKSIFVKRGGGSKERRKSMDQIHWLLDNGHVFCMFPEGGRSRSGRVQTDSATYSVGEMIQQHPTAKVLTMYIRGDEQKTWGKWPKFGTTVEADIRELKIGEIEQGRKGARDISIRIIEDLIKLETEYLSREAARIATRSQSIGTDYLAKT
jgi:hypothetical protein